MVAHFSNTKLRSCLDNPTRAKNENLIQSLDFCTGAMFVVNGAMYALAAPIWGWICDKKMSPIYVTTMGTFLITVSFVFIGPAPFIPMETKLSVSIASLVVHGIGFAAQLVAGFSGAHREAIANGFADTLNTYAIVSGLWTASFALGAFIGPSVAGVIVDYCGKTLSLP